MKKLHIFLSMVLVPFLSSWQVNDPRNDFLKTEVASLYETVKRFQGVWYKEKNPDKFWNFVASNARLRELKPVGSSFLAAFDKGPEEAKIETLKIEGISKEGLRLIQKNKLKPLPLNPYTAHELAIFKAEDWFLKKALNLTDEELAEAKKDNFLPQEDFFLVLYGVSGIGYHRHGFVSFWVQENKEWKLFHFIMVGI